VVKIAGSASEIRDHLLGVSTVSSHGGTQTSAAAATETEYLALFGHFLAHYAFIQDQLLPMVKAYLTSVIAFNFANSESVNSESLSRSQRFPSASGAIAFPFPRAIKRLDAQLEIILAQDEQQATAKLQADSERLVDNLTELQSYSTQIREARIYREFDAEVPISSAPRNPTAVAAANAANGSQNLTNNQNAAPPKRRPNYNKSSTGKAIRSIVRLLRGYEHFAPKRILVTPASKTFAEYEIQMITKENDSAIYRVHDRGMEKLLTWRDTPRPTATLEDVGLKSLLEVLHATMPMAMTVPATESGSSNPLPSGASATDTRNLNKYLRSHKSLTASMIRQLLDHLKRSALGWCATSNDVKHKEKRQELRENVDLIVNHSATTSNSANLAPNMGFGILNLDVAISGAFLTSERSNLTGVEFQAAHDAIVLAL